MPQIFNNKFIKTITIVCSLLLVSCGGGGGGGSSSGGNNGGGSGGTTNTSPTISLSASENVNSGATFSITASASDSDGTVASYQWVQTSGQSVSISDTTSATLTFVAPTVTSDTVLSFQLTVTDNDNATASATIQVTVLNTGGGSLPPTTPPTTNSTSLSGKIVDLKYGTELEGVVVSVGNMSTTTDSNGSYEFTDLPYDTRTIVTARHNDYTTQVKTVSISTSEKNAKLTLKLTPDGVDQNFSANRYYVIEELNTRAWAEFEQDITEDSNGVAFAGRINAQLSYLNPSQISDVMPGDYSTEYLGRDRFLQSYGAINLSISDDSGNPLSIKSGKSLKVRIPYRSKSALPADGSTSGLYFFDETSAKWIDKGIATFVYSASNSYFEATIDQPGTWGVKDLYNEINIVGCVEDLHGNRLSGISVFTDGDNYSGSSTAQTDSNGEFSINAKANAEIQLWAQNSGARSNMIVSPTESFDLMTTSCLSIADVAITITLSWGYEPKDLDAHLIGPSYHLFWLDEGSLTGYPWARLDRDDTSELGPEVYTITRFSEPGTYKFKVDNFSETYSPSLFESGAKVELNDRGDITLFTPPSGQGGNLSWNVFEIVVDTNYNYTIQPVQTWSPTISN